MELTALMSAFAAKLGIEALEVKDGACALAVDGIPMEIVESQDGSRLVVSAKIGTPPMEKTVEFLRLILEANTSSFALQDEAFGQLPGESELVLQWRLATQGLELDNFCTRFEAFLNRVEQWRQALDGFGAAADEAAIIDEEAPALGSMNYGLMPV